MIFSICWTSSSSCGVYAFPCPDSCSHSRIAPFLLRVSNSNRTRKSRDTIEGTSRIGSKEIPNIKLRKLRSV